MNIEILPLTGAVKYLGWKFSFDHFQGIELQNRIRVAWAKFMAQKQELTGKDYALKVRLRLFEAVVSPCLLYGCEAWTLTKTDEYLLQRTQRKMLRMISGAKRRMVQRSTDEHESETTDDKAEVDDMDEDEVLEPWVDWVKRTTRTIEGEMNKLNIKNWVHQARARKWNYAKRLMTHDESRWTRVALDWNPELHFDGTSFRSIQGSRAQGRPHTRWSDELANFMTSMELETTWMELAKQTRIWDELKTTFRRDELRFSRHQE